MKRIFVFVIVLLTFFMIAESSARLRRIKVDPKTPKVVEVYNITSNTTITAAQCQGKTITNSGATGAVVATLPTATVGLIVHFSCKAAQNFDINPHGSETIRYITDAAGDAVRISTLGEYLTLVCEEAG